MKGVYFLSYPQMQRVIPHPEDVVISIADRFYQPQLAEGFMAVLRFRFSDIDLKNDLVPVPLLAEPFTSEMADRLKIELDNLLTTHSARYLIIHCYAGLSRSCAIAWWASRYYAIKLLTQATTNRVNHFVLETLPGEIAPPDETSDSALIRTQEEDFFPYISPY